MAVTPSILLQPKSSTIAPVKIAIIGAGFTGLTAALKLAERGHKVVIFEKESLPGGLAQGFKGRGWQWPLEKHYHHLFVSDKESLKFAKRVGVRIEFKKPITATFFKDSIYQIDNAASLLKFSKLDFIGRIRVGAVILFLKLNPFWKPLESVSAKNFLTKTMGRGAWRILWQPLFEKKFGRAANQVPTSWFWARIKKRSSRLGYPLGGFQFLADKAAKKIVKKGGEILYDTPILKIRKKGLVFEILTESKRYIFDKVICTLPTSTFLKIMKGLTPAYQKKLFALRGLGALNLLLELKQPFLPKSIYWLNVNEPEFPFLCIVEHTNFVARGKYSGGHLVYVGNYLPPSHQYFFKSTDQLVRKYLPYLKKVNHNFSKSWIKKAYLFKEPFTQPLITLNYSRRLPRIATPVVGLYLANIQQVYPWDRGTNYSIELGNKVAELIR